MKDALEKQLQKIPLSAGVYFFRDKSGEIIYIGKAVNLKARVKSYFSQKLYGLKAAMIPDIAKIDYKKTDTEIDALILESQYIKKHRPKYNVMLKDDKNYFYAVITAGEFPKIYITHQPFSLMRRFASSFSHQLGGDHLTPPVFEMRSAPLRANSTSPLNDSKRRMQSASTVAKIIVLGPYTDGTALKTTLRFLRKIFPYCTCKTQHKLPCLKAHLRLCPGICCAYSASSKQPSNYNELIKTYKKNIKSIIDILSGKKRNILARLEKDMRAAAKRENFEKAAEIRNKISALKNIFEHRIETKTEAQDFSKAAEKLSEIFGSKISRIEFYDISNIQGQLATGSMVVFDGEKINKNEYKKFKIKTILSANDPAMIKEVLERRLKHIEWPMPDLIIVDGGVTQLDAAKKVFQNSPAQTKCASLAKNPDRLFISPLKAIALKDISENARLLLQNLRDEAHRFAISYHKKLRSKKLKSEFSY